MANSTSGNPWKLDTAGVIQTRPVTIKAMEWRPTTEGDDLLIQSNDGSEIWSIKAIAADSNGAIDYKWPGENITFQGFNLVTFDNTGTGGWLRVWIE